MHMREERIKRLGYYLRIWYVDRYRRRVEYEMLNTVRAVLCGSG